VTVNGVRWAERPSLLDSPPDAQDYMTVADDAGQTTVIFGDGYSGARPPSGRGNIRARYRKGLGLAGNVSAGAIQQLIDTLPGIQQVVNPQPGSGGADPEREDQIRSKAPASLATFGRAVSLEDYARLALSFPGVAKASAAWTMHDPVTLQAIAHPYILLTVATADLIPLAQQTVLAAKLRTFLDQRRDPNVPLRIGDFTPVFVDLAAVVDVDDRFGRQATQAAALAALNPGLNPDNSAGYFAFERLAFGQSIYLSAVYAALQSVPGVRNATITALRRPDLDTNPATVRDAIFIRPTEIAVIRNDPADSANLFGKLTITLDQGGFVDS
jgi:predicted phage baseplate assembly protein